MRIIICLLGLSIFLAYMPGCVVPGGGDHHGDDHHGIDHHDDFHDDHH